ncbi:MAG TPA: UvrD-helicase domain-containing protein, partial [Chiayiivirga sp.]|nr:UvrD-helicase domain-containing protein [Chiayiivirga sp.]
MNALTDWTALDLSSGHRSRVEASAGTGKTWTLAVLYLRLVLEQGFSPRQIVVATYTNAAAAELAQRLRARLESSLARARRFDAGEPEPSESDLRWLHRRWRDPARRDADARRLALALAELDLAPCGTLHSLCSRILAEHPFAAGASFQVPELTALEPWHAALADDLWRLVHARRDAVATDAHEAWDAAQPCLADLARAALARELKAVLQPGVVVPAPPAVDEAALWDGALAAALRALAAREGIWNANAALPRGLIALAELIEAQGTNAAAFSKERKQLAERIRERTGLKKTLQADPGICTTLDAASGFFEHYAALLESRRLRRLAAMQGWGRAQLDARLRAANRLGFDELLTTVERALAPAADGSRALADALIGAWPVALIDEFQDTDPVQYAVLDAIYREADGTTRGHLLMIGDPKQAIYRFRGGDIHTYTRAIANIDAGRALRLSVNYRSSKAFVDAVNA